MSQTSRSAFTSLRLTLRAQPRPREFRLKAQPRIFSIHHSPPNRYLEGVSDTLVVNEIYLSLQGESTFAGLPCVFIRLTACDLRCSYCDTAYAFSEGKRMPFDAILARIRELASPFAGRSITTTTLPAAGAASAGQCSSLRMNGASDGCTTL